MTRSLSKRVFLLIIAIFFMVIPFLFDSKFFLNILILTLLYATVSGAWNILGGYGGQLSLGHALFFGLGAYTSSLLYLHLGLTPWIGIFVAAAVAIMAGIFIGLPTFRLKGPFFTLATISFAEVIRHVADYWRELTKGSVGINIPFEPGLSNMIFREYQFYYLITLIIFLSMLAITYWIDKTKLGYYLKAIREDEESAETMGINVTKYKLLAMVISAGLTGITGVIFAQYLLFFDPQTVFNLNFSIQVALITIIGGVGTVFGPLIGALLIIPLNEFLRASFPFINGLDQFIYGIALILIVSLMPNGLLPIIKRGIDRLKKKILNTDSSVKGGKVT